MATYQLEFGHLGEGRPVPDLTVTTGDVNVLNRAVAEHARPHITPVLTAMGHPEYADCLFQMSSDRTSGQFLYLDLAGGKGARFLAARITTTPVRIKSERTAGSSVGSAVIVDRRSRFGNPYRVHGTLAELIDGRTLACASPADARKYVTAEYVAWLKGEGPDLVAVGRKTFDRRRIQADLPMLRGRDLACTCPLPDEGQPDHCHAAALLDLVSKLPKEN